MKYVCLLRGINVGGNRKVDMAQLKQALEDMGMIDVVTYINSGNVVFTSHVEPNCVSIQRRLETTFGFEMPTLVLPAERVKAIAAAIPDEWRNDIETKSDVAYLFREIDSPDILATIGYKPDIETALYIPGAILWSIPRPNITKGSLHKVIGQPPYRMMTVRNVNTARKLAQLVS